MLKDAPIVPYVPVSDLARARKFYEKTLGFEPGEEYSDQAVVYKCGEGTWFFMYKSPGAGTSKASTAFWPVSDVEAEVADLKARGVVFEEYGRRSQDRLVQRQRGKHPRRQSAAVSRLRSLGFRAAACVAPADSSSSSAKPTATSRRCFSICAADVLSRSLRRTKSEICEN